MSEIRGNTAGLEPATDKLGDALPETAKNQVLTIAAVAAMFKISTLTLRLLELRGLIRRREAGGDRVYSWADCERVALLVKARKAGFATRELAPVLKAMDASVPNAVADDGRLQCLFLIHALERRQQAISNLLGELYRIDWQLAERLNVADSGGLDEVVARP
jgi:DNA-binding transcriptional MerR regulator